MGSTHITCASALAFMGQGKPSKKLHFMHGLVGVAFPCASSSSRMPSGRWKGLRPMPCRSAANLATAGACVTGGWG